MNKKKIAVIVISIIVCLLVYLPTPKGREPQLYEPNQPTKLQDLQFSRDRLRTAAYVSTPAPGAEDVEFDNKGYVYSGLSDGSIIRFKGNGSDVEVVAKSEGAIFGIDINSKFDKLVLADQKTGIKVLDLNTRKFQYLVSEFNGLKFASPNGVVFGANDETLYFSVSSDDIRMSEFHEMLLYSGGNGKIFSYKFATNQTELLLDHLYFVNGLEYIGQQNCLYFVETSRSRLMRLHLEGEKKGQTELVVGDILGYPDNVKLAESGDLWVAIPALRDSFSNMVDHNPIIRKVLLNMHVPLGMFLALANMKYAGGIKVNKSTGQIVDYFFGEADKIDCISGINEKNGKLYLSSLHTNKIAIVDLNSKSQITPQMTIKTDNSQQASTQANQQQVKETKKQVIQQSIPQAKIEVKQQKQVVNVQVKTDEAVKVNVEVKKQATESASKPTVHANQEKVKPNQEKVKPNQEKVKPNPRQNPRNPQGGKSSQQQQQYSYSRTHQNNANARSRTGGNKANNNQL